MCSINYLWSAAFILLTIGLYQEQLSGQKKFNVFQKILILPCAFMAGSWSENFSAGLIVYLTLLTIYVAVIKKEKIGKFTVAGYIPLSRGTFFL